MEFNKISNVFVVVTVLGSYCLPQVCSTSPPHRIVMPTDDKAAPSSSNPSTAPLPSLPQVFSKEAFGLGASSVINLWEHGLRLQNRGRARVGISSAAEPPTPLTVVAPDASRMANLAPQGAVHPLYHDAPTYTALRHAFLLDSFVQKEVDPQDGAMTTAVGLTVGNMNGKALVFKRDQQGALSVNGITVTKQQRLSDGTQLYVVDGFLFSHEADVRKAFTRLQEEKSRDGSSQCPFGSCQPQPAPVVSADIGK